MSSLSLYYFDVVALWGEYVGECRPKGHFYDDIKSNVSTVYLFGGVRVLIIVSTRTYRSEYGVLISVSTRK